MAFSSDGQRLVLAGEPRDESGNSKSQIWDLGPNGQPANRPAFSFPSVAVGSFTAALNPAGNWLASVAAINKIEIHNVSPGAVLTQPVLTLLGNSDPRGLTFSLDGARLAVGYRDSAVKVWDMPSGRELLTLTGQTGPVNGVAFSPDGSRLATAGADGTMRVYALRLEDLIALAKTRVTRTLTDAECVTYLHMEKCPAP